MCMTEIVIENLPTKKISGPNVFTGKFYQIFKKNLSILLQKIEENGHLFNENNNFLIIPGQIL